MKIIPLSKKNYKEASNLVVKIFDCTPDEEDYPPRWFKASLNPKDYKKLYEKYGTLKLKYYIAIEDKKIIGTTGYYTTKKDKKEAYWLAWWCVHPNYRNKGIGTKLIKFIITKAKKANKKFLRLYTSDEKNEIEAQKIYDKLGFRITKKLKNKDKTYTTIFRELKL